MRLRWGGALSVHIESLIQDVKYLSSMKGRLFPVAAILVAAASMIAAAPALAEGVLPTYNGDMTFVSIHDPTGPEEFSWEVVLDGTLELEQLDDKHVKVVHAKEPDVTAMIIDAELAHDAEGSDVPTTLTLSGGNVITLTVHHRAGNPTMGGAPFVYPITAGAGWEGGFEAVQVFMPPPGFPAEQGQSASVPIGCVVPALVGKSLKSDRKRLRKASCRLGRVGGKGSKTARVIKQSRQPGELLGPGARVAVTLAEPGRQTRD